MPPKAANPPVPGPTKAGPAPVLTPKQQQRLAAMPEAARDQVLLWLTMGDRILHAEALKRLKPAPGRPEVPQTLPELLAQIQSDPSYPARAADWLCTVLNDRKSYSGFKARCEEAWRGELSVDRLLSAFEQATGPKAKNRGALSMHAVRQNE